jgi:hypothetical protein
MKQQITTRDIEYAMAMMLEVLLTQAEDKLDRKSRKEKK